jgi:hypothetical protein
MPFPTSSLMSRKAVSGEVLSSFAHFVRLMTLHCRIAELHASQSFGQSELVHKQKPTWVLCSYLQIAAAMPPTSPPSSFCVLRRCALKPLAACGASVTGASRT